MSSKRTLIKQEKLSILKETAENGVTTTLEKDGIYPPLTTVDAINSMKWVKNV